MENGSQNYVKPRFRKISMWNDTAFRFIVVGYAFLIVVPFICMNSLKQQEIRLENERLEAEREREEQIAREEEEARLEEQRREEEEAERIANGPIYLNRYCTSYSIDYYLSDGEFILTGEDVGDYSTVTTLDSFVAIPLTDSYIPAFIYPSNLYVDREIVYQEDSNNAIMTFTGDDNNKLILSYETINILWGREENEKYAMEYLRDRLGVTVDEDSVTVNNFNGAHALEWRGTKDGNLAGGVFDLDSGIESLIVVCPQPTDEQDALYKEYYIRTMISGFNIWNLGMKVPTWETFLEEVQ